MRSRPMTPPSRWSAVGAVLVAAAWLTYAGVGAQASQPDVAGYVDPFMGTGGGPIDGAHNSPGPFSPFGMIQWGPDTTPESSTEVDPTDSAGIAGALASALIGNGGGGYGYEDTKIRGFSARHLNGAGCQAGGDVLFMPTTTPVMTSPAKAGSTDFNDIYVPSFSHDDEEAEAGYYRVGLDPETPERIDAEFTATMRSGLSRLTFPPTADATVLVNTTGTKLGNSAGSVHVDPARREITGSTTSAGMCLVSSDQYTIYFVAQFDRPFHEYGTWTRQELQPGSNSAQDSAPTPLGPTGVAQLAQTGAYATFDTTSAPTVEVRLGISFVSIEGARANLAAEVGRRPFDAVRTKARDAWNEALGQIEIEGGSEADRKVFYSALRAALIHPTTVSDVDGRYRGMDGKVHQVRPGRRQYSDYVGWDQYRNQLPLVTLIAPKVAADFVSSMLAYEHQSGWLQEFIVANARLDSSRPAIRNTDATIASVWALGGRRFELADMLHNFDVEDALRAAVRGGTATAEAAGELIADYQALGYIPFERETNPNLNLPASVAADAIDEASPETARALEDLAMGGKVYTASETLEYAVDDFAISQLAAAAGDQATCRAFLERSGNWRNVFDPSIRAMRARNADGSWADRSRGFRAGGEQGAVYTWQVPHDPAGLIEALGGSGEAAERLDYFFEELNARGTDHAYIGDEPASNAAWLYDWMGQPYKTQEVTRRAITSLFSAGPEGMPGNNDQGHLSAWYVFAALGFNPTVPGTDILALGSPLFPKATIHLPDGDLVIEARGAAAQAPYVQSLFVNGEPHDKPWLRLADVEAGGSLQFQLSEHPSIHWGSRPEDAPPSFGSEDVGVCGDTQPVVTPTTPDGVDRPSTQKTTPIEPPLPATGSRSIHGVWFLPLVLSIWLGRRNRDAKLRRQHAGTQ